MNAFTGLYVLLLKVSTSHHDLAAFRTTLSSKKLYWSFSISSALWRNFGPLFFKRLLQTAELYAHLFFFRHSVVDLIQSWLKDCRAGSCKNAQIITPLPPCWTADMLHLVLAKHVHCSPLITKSCDLILRFDLGVNFLGHSDHVNTNLMQPSNNFVLLL